MARLEIQQSKTKLRLDRIPVDQALADKAAYEKHLEKLQERMLRLQQAVWHQKKRGILVLEGWDASGKGGAIRRLTEALDPRGVHVHSIAAPTADEQGRHYLFRFWNKLPPPGHIAIFDRSWYGRVLVERIEGFCDKAAWKRAYDEINEFEHTLMDDGVLFGKIFLHISKDEQLRRFVERLQNPTKNWKFGEEDLRNRERWPEYVEAIEDMFDRTSTEAAPWHVVGGNRKWHARVRVLEIALEVLSRGVDLEQPLHDPKFAAEAARRLGVDLVADKR
jgi:PPK2 family polyphosphate:nucleotide phosphotransferase